MTLIPTSSQPASVAAAEIKSRAVATYQHLLAVFATGAQMFWRHPQATPAEIAAALGTQGVEVFRLHGQIGQLLAAIDPAAVAEAASVVGEFTYGEDGIVTVVEPVVPVPTPAPEPDPPLPSPEPTPETPPPVEEVAPSLAIDEPGAQNAT